MKTNTRVYTFPLKSGGAVGMIGTADPNDNVGQPLTALGYLMAIGAPLLTFLLIALFGGLAGMDTLTTVSAGHVTLLWFLTLAFYLLYDLSWYFGIERSVNAAYYKYHGTDKLFDKDERRAALMALFFPMAATSNFFLVILPSIEHAGQIYSYRVTCFRALINGAWCYGTLGVIQGITIPNFPLEISGLVFLSGALISLFTSLTVVAVAQAMDVVEAANCTST